MTLRTGAGGALAILLSIGACRPLSLCQEGTPCDERFAQAGSGGAAGSGTDRDPSCQEPFDDCDRSPLNGCETDLWQDPRHCGSCDARCDGVCSRRGCHVPELISDRAITPRSSMAVTADYVYFLSREEPDGSVRLMRVATFGGPPEVFTENLPLFEQVAIFDGRIYLWGNGNNLWSGTGPADFVDEGFATGSVASDHGVVFAERDGALVARALGEQAWVRQNWFREEYATDFWLASMVEGLCIVRFSSGEAPVHEILLAREPELPDGGLVTLADGVGNPLRVRIEFGGTVYWLVEDGSNENKLFRVRSGESSEVWVAASGIDDFTFDGYYLYLTRTLSPGHEILVTSITSHSEVLHLGTPLEMRFPQAVGDQLWFFAQSRLQRVDLQVGAF